MSTNVTRACSERLSVRRKASELRATATRCQSHRSPARWLKAPIEANASELRSIKR
jgi:hypothetical protein